MVLLIKQEVIMKRTLLSLIALGAFVTSFAGTIVKEMMQDPTIWEYNDGTHDRTSNPDCRGAGPLCATEYFLNEDGSLGAATGNVRNGVRAN
ncbi:hypothetical protein SAMN05216436_10181 [bacterium A37T11]|nr:hypothetical protein SAMN05216436_10181 [bacterium A37T11]